ncbi:MAG: hypothetical protein CEO12_252 [Parcubacteria group bacterium Gr01-1014_46]|nr:MAG: hypothetical protein CEO12_252 [Parcubacteria group bacterium Gr01-1014_46]
MVTQALVYSVLKQGGSAGLGEWDVAQRLGEDLDEVHTMLLALQANGIVRSVPDTRLAGTHDEFSVVWVPAQ